MGVEPNQYERNVGIAVAKHRDRDVRHEVDFESDLPN